MREFLKKDRKKGEEQVPAFNFIRYARLYYSQEAASPRQSDTDVNVVSSCVPIAETVPMIATEISAAIRPYSIAVAPSSFLNSFLSSFMINILFCLIDQIYGSLP